MEFEYYFFNYSPKATNINRNFQIFYKTFTTFLKTQNNIFFRCKFILKKTKNTVYLAIIHFGKQSNLFIKAPCFCIAVLTRDTLILYFFLFLILLQSSFPSTNHNNLQKCNRDTNRYKNRWSSQALP